MHEIQRTSRRKYPVEILTSREVEAIVGQCSLLCPTGVRNAALIVGMYRSGMRISESLGILPHQVDFFSGSILIQNGKGGKSRTVGIDPWGAVFFQRWVGQRNQFCRNRSVPLFCTLKSTPLSPCYVRRMMKRLARRAGIEKRVHPHGLRHTHA